MAQQQYDYIKLDGVIVPDTETTRDSVVSDYKETFGQDLETRPQTPQGVLINQTVLIRNAVIRNNAALANQINPNDSGGIFLDAIWALTGGQRSKAKPSTVTCDLTGQPGAIIPVGVSAKTSIAAGDNVFVSTEIITLDGSGLGSGLFESQETGAINAPAGSINIIDDGVLGWETVTNLLAATQGSSAQSDESLRVLRRQTLALQGTSTPFAITSALNRLDSVKSLKLLENLLPTPTVIQNVPMLANSIYVSVNSEDTTEINLEIATVLLAKKSIGANWTGDITVVVKDPTTLQDYDVRFSRADQIIVLAKVYIQNQFVPDPINSVKQSILAYANGQLEGEEGFVVGADVSPFELSGAINSLFPEIFVQRVEISYSSPINFTTDELLIEAFQVARILEGGIEVIES